MYSQKIYLPVFTGFYNGAFCLNNMLEEATSMYNELKEI